MTAPRISLTFVLVLAAAGCFVALDSGETVKDDSEPPPDTEDSGDTDTDWWEDPTGDLDQDGYSIEEGDCDDEDPEVNPGVASDGCDGLDNDCDGQTDEDFAADEYEPNDDEGLYLGQLEDEEQELVFAYLHPETDVDRFQFWVDDSAWSWFSLEAWLYAVPDDADYSLELIWVEDLEGEWRGTVASADETGQGGVEVVDWGGDTFYEDGGLYEVVVRSTSGSGCSAPYQLQIISGGW
jgi:hypothetical protein